MSALIALQAQYVQCFTDARKYHSHESEALAKIDIAASCL